MLMGHQPQILQTQNYVVWSQRPPPFPPDSHCFQSSQSLSQSHRLTGNRVWSYRKHTNNSGFGCKPINKNESKSKTHFKARRFQPKKKKFRAPLAPRNTTSFIMRAKKSGGIAPFVSPCPVTPVILPSPTLSPTREVLVDTAKQEWGVDGYGSMKGLIRLRSMKEHEESEDGEDGYHEENGWGDGGRKCVEVEKRLLCDLSRFEMIYPSYGGGDEQTSVLKKRVDDQDTHLAHLEQENLSLKEKLFFLERDVVEMKRRVKWLENEGGRRACWLDNCRASGNASESNDENFADVCSEKSVNADGEGELSLVL